MKNNIHPVSISTVFILWKYVKSQVCENNHNELLMNCRGKFDMRCRYNTQLVEISAKNAF